MIYNLRVRLCAVAACAAMTILFACSGQKDPAPAPKAEASPVSPSLQYEGRLVRRPGSSAEDGKVYVVQQGKKHWLIDGGWCATHGCRFPEDVVQIPADALESIPTGDPIR